MPGYTRNMTEDATYWPPGQNDGFGGVGYGSPVSLKVRWQDKSDLFRDSEGREVVSSAIVYTSQPVENTGKLLRAVSVSATPPTGALEIRNHGQSPSLDGSLQLNKVWL